MSMLGELAALVARESGIRMGTHQMASLSAALERAGHRDAGAALRAATVAGGEGALQRLIDEVTVQETFFLRDAAQLATIDWRSLLERARRRGDDRVRVWSAACATGEEPYTIVMALREGGWGNHPIEVSGSDASEAALAKARQAIYRERSFRALPEHLRVKYFKPVEGGLQLDPSIVSRVNFHQVNLVASEQTAPLAVAPVIFCRNVFIYFSSGSIARTVAAFARRMPLGGYLFVGASESLLKVTDNFDLEQLDDAFVYRLKNKPAA